MSASVVVIAGVGPGTGGALATTFAKAGYAVALLARKLETLQPVEDAIKKSGGQAASFPTDVASAESVRKAFRNIKATLPGDVKCAVFNASAGLAIKPFLETSVDALEQALKVSTLGAFTFAQESVKVLLEAKGGSLIFTGATASLKGSAKFSTFAPPKFAQRALTQCLAREFGPQNIHVAHVIIDGLINTENVASLMGEEQEAGTRLKPEAIAAAYLYLHQQDRSAWTQELDLRPSQEKF